MARIPESEIERLKREVSVERLAEARGVKLKRHGADLIGLCGVRAPNFMLAQEFLERDEPGTVGNTYQFDAFGMPIASTGTTTNSYL